MSRRQINDSQLMDDVIANRTKCNEEWDRYIFACTQTGRVDKEILYYLVAQCNKWEQEYQTKLFSNQDRERAIRDMTEEVLTY